MKMKKQKKKTKEDDLLLSPAAKGIIGYIGLALKKIAIASQAGKK